MSVCTVFVVALLLQLCSCIDEGDGSYYTTRFMVEVEGGHKMADKLGQTHGMRTLGRVSIMHVERELGGVNFM